MTFDAERYKKLLGLWDDQQSPAALAPDITTTTMMFLVLLAGLVAAADATCKATNGDPCLAKADYHPYWLSNKEFTTGPCFKDDDGKGVCTNC